MRYRKLTATGDMVFGQGVNNFYTDNEAVRQAIETRLLLYKGTFWRDTNDGTPYFQNILASGGSENNLRAIESILRQRILGTEGVTNLLSVNSSFDAESREYTYNATVQTLYSTISLTGTL